MKKIILAYLLSTVLLVSFVGCGTEVHYHYGNESEIPSTDKPTDKNETESTGSSVIADKETSSDVSSKAASSDKVTSNQPSLADKAKINRDEAKAIAFKDGGINKTDARNVEVETDIDYGVLTYEVEFESGGFEYKYEINGESGKILHKEKEKESDRKTKNPTNSAVNSSQPVSSQADSSQKGQTVSTVKTKISRDEAKSLAFKDAGVKESEIREFEIELDKDNGIWLYEIEFKKGKTEYKYEINAQNGKITEKEKDID